MRFIHLALLSLLAACGAKPRTTPRPGMEYLKAIEVEGNTELGHDRLVSGLALRRTQQRGRAPDPYLIQVDADRIRGEYLRKGFLDVDVHSRVERHGDAATVVYSIDEGKRATTRVVINGLNGDPDLTAEKVRALLPLRDGEPFDYAIYQKAKPLLRGAAEDAGYARSTFSPTVWADPARGEAVVELDYFLGPKCRFGKIEITGVDGRLADAVRDRLQFETGDTYSTRAIAATQRRLYAIQRFSTVQVQADNHDIDDAVVDVKIAVSQAARHEIKLGGGAGIDPTAYEVRARGSYSITGFPTQMDTSTLDFRPAYGYLRATGGWEPRVRALGKIERQDIFWTYSTGAVEAGYNYLAYEAYTSYGPHARAGLGTPVITDRLRLNVAWDFEQLGFRHISPLVDPMLQAHLGIDHANRIGNYEQALVLDLRDNPTNTTRGLYGELKAVEGTRFAGGAFDYLQLIPELRGYVPLGGVVLAAKARAGTFYGDAPATERFFSGGASNHRGFGERQLSPFVHGEVDGSDETVPFGGTTLVETGLEARIPVTTWRKMGIGTVLFLDGGDVTEDRGQIDLGNLHWAAGVGLRVKTVVGPVRADLGYRLNRTGPMDPAPGSRYAFHFSIGEAF